MRVTVTPTETQSLDEFQTVHGVSGYKWMVTYQIDGEDGLSCTFSLPSAAETALDAQHRVLLRIHAFLKAATVAAQNYQM